MLNKLTAGFSVNLQSGSTSCLVLFARPHLYLGVGFVDLNFVSALKALCSFLQASQGLKHCAENQMSDHESVMK